MTTSKRNLHDPMSRSHLYRKTQRKFLAWALVVAAVVAVLSVPVIVNSELRLEAGRTMGFVPDNPGELVASGDSGASLIVLPTEHNVDGTDRPELRFLAAFITWPEQGQLRLEPLDGGDDLTIPLESFELVSTSPNASEMYIRGPSQAALVDVHNLEIVELLSSDEVPDVSWDWQTAVWQRGLPVWQGQTYSCDRVSNNAQWVGCFSRPMVARYLFGDWHLDLHRYGAPDEVHEVARGLGSQPIIGFTADDAWLYVYNEYGIRRFDVEAVTSD